MEDFNIWGTTNKKKSKNNDSLLGGNLGFGLGASKKQKNRFDIGIGLGNQRSKPERDDKRTFGITIQKKTYDNQNGKCFKCHIPVKSSHMEYHHLKAWSKGGKTTSDNCVGLCHNCHKDIHDDARIKEGDKKRKAPKNDNLLGGILFGQTSKRSKNSPYGL